MPSKIALSISVLTAALGMVSAVPHYEYSSYNGGHNVESINENKLIDLSDLGLGIDILKRTDYSACKKYVYSYNGGHNVYSVNENKLVDASDATVDISVLSLDGRKKKTWHKAPRYCLEYIKSYNGGHNVVVNNENKGVDLSGLLANIDVLKRNAPEFSYEFSSYNGGHNFESTNENKLIDLSDLLADVSILKKRHYPEVSYYNGGHNVESTSESKLIDVSDLTALVNVLSKRHGPTVESYNGGHNVESTSENKLIDLSDLTALVSVLSKRSLKGYGSQIHARDITEDLYRRTNDDEDCTCTKKSKPTPPKQTTTTPPKDTSNGGGDCSSDDTPAPAPSASHKPKPKHHHHSKPSSTWTAPSTSTWTPPAKDTPTKTTPTTTATPTTTPTKPTCTDSEVYVDQGHNVVSKSENKLLDLSNITIQIGLLDGLFGGDKKTTKTVPADSTCTAKEGCCVAKSVYYYNGGHNTQVTNDNKGIDLSGLNLGLNIL
ncbi:repellent protein 1 precursor [Sporisorium scitamineum]|uniref:Repellent protein 1 n=1 Tax=Sporisorium scitamineum TaxID=49012 RepID=A0A127Z4G3_9BASI|nr:repellent protein 1 precursor [Sporisorium scitamineum]